MIGILGGLIYAFFSCPVVYAFVSLLPSSEPVAKWILLPGLITWLAAMVWTFINLAIETGRDLSSSPSTGYDRDKNRRI